MRLGAIYHTHRRAIAIACIVVVALIASVALFIIWQRSTSPTDPYSRKSPSLVDDTTLKSLATSQPLDIDTSHLAEGLVPPTNTWYSGLALQAEPKPVFSYPNSFKPTDNGFEFSLPKVNATDRLVTGAHAADIVVTIDTADHYMVTDYDELSVELTYYTDDEQPVVTTRIASGLPYVYIHAAHATTIRFTGTASREEAATKLRSNGAVYGMSRASGSNRISLSADDHISFFSVPNEDAFHTVRSYADTSVESGAVSYKKAGDTFETTFTHRTTDHKPVLFAQLPHQQGGGTTDVTYRSVLGDLTTTAGTTFRYTTDKIPVHASLDLSGISDSEKTMLKKQLQDDIASSPDPKPDTYFGGKQLYRMAQLLDIAHQLNDERSATAAKDQLKKDLETWLRPGDSDVRSFLYSSSMHGIVGNEASFGSDKEFNDHHFHYGYFIYAAAVLAKYDSEFLDTHRKMVDLLVADIANYNRGESLPLRRSFDAYAGHSWASGTSPFADGNNQESTSEAINAWVATSLWANQTNNDALQLEADWMLSNELTTAKRYWLNLDVKPPDYLAAYDQPLYSIVWGAKREYSTFFSDEANAKLAIQLLPLSPTLHAAYADLPSSLFASTSTDQPYGDYILMASPDATLDQAKDLPDIALDDGNSRTYLYAYLLAR